VQRLAADGAAVALTYSASATAAEKLVAQVEAEGATAVAIHADSADPDQVVRSVDETVTRLGGLDILVNNAGVATPGDAASFPLAEFDRMVAINIRAVFVATQRALAHLGAGGRIINLGSINADRAPVPYLSVYSMTKAAVAGMTRGLARELAPRGITINNLQVGPIATDMNPEVGDFADEVRRVFLELGRAFGREFLTGECTPPVDVYETDEAVEIVVDVPGVDASAVRLIAKNETLLIVGDKSTRRARSESSFHLVERGFGRFARAVRLGPACDPSKATARMISGELRIAVPKIAERRGKPIEISVSRAANG